MSETPVYAVTLEEVSRQIEAVQKSIDDQRKFRDEQKAMLKLTGRGDLERNKALKQHQTLWRGIKSDIKESYAVAMKLGRFGVGLGLTGAGLATAGYYGMNRMATDAGNDRKESQGIAGSVGELNSAKLNFEKLFGNVKGTIDQLRDIRYDATKKPYLDILTQKAGITQEQEQGMTNTELLSELLPAIKKTYDESDKSQLGIDAYRQSIGLGSFNIEDLTRFGQMSQEEIGQAQERYKKGIPEFEQKDKDAREYQDFARQFDETMMGISSSFKRTLVDLSPKLRELTDVTGDAVKRIVESKDAYKLITKAADGLEKAVKYLSSPEATMDFEAFMTEVKDAGRFLHYLTHPGEAAAAGWDAAKQDFSYGVDHAGEMASEMWQTAKDHVTGAKEAIDKSSFSTDNKLDAYRQAIFNRESNGGDPMAINSSQGTGAWGKYQVLGQNLINKGMKPPSISEPEAVKKSWLMQHMDEVNAVGEEILKDSFKKAEGDVKTAYAKHYHTIPKSYSAEHAKEVWALGDKVEADTNRYLAGSSKKEKSENVLAYEAAMKEAKEAKQQGTFYTNYEKDSWLAKKDEQINDSDDGIFYKKDHSMLDQLKRAFNYSPDKPYEQFMAERKQQDEEWIATRQPPEIKQQTQEAKQRLPEIKQQTQEAERQTPETKQQAQQARAQDAPSLIPQPSGYATQRQRVDVQVQSLVRVVQNPGAEFTSNALGIMQ